MAARKNRKNVPLQERGCTHSINGPRARAPALAHLACLALHECSFAAAAAAAVDSPRVSKSTTTSHRLSRPSTARPPNPGLLLIRDARGETCHEKAAALWFGAGPTRSRDSTAATLRENVRDVRVIRAVDMVQIARFFQTIAALLGAHMCSAELPWYQAYPHCVCPCSRSRCQRIRLFI